MPRLLAFLLALSLGLALTAGAAFAETKDRPPGNKGSQERLAFCDNAYSGCIKLNCQDLPTVAQGEACVSQCNGIRDDCNAARLGGTVDALETGLNLSTMALEGIRIDLVEIDLGGIGKGRLEAICKLVAGAIFAEGSATSFGCVAPDCDGNGSSCAIVCTGTHCTGFLPDRPEGTINLIGVLQDGDKINHFAAPETEGKPKPKVIDGIF